LLVREGWERQRAAAEPRKWKKTGGAHAAGQPCSRRLSLHSRHELSLAVCPSRFLLA
jgi:hypothetical protein